MAAQYQQNPPRCTHPLSTINPHTPPESQHVNAPAPHQAPTRKADPETPRTSKEQYPHPARKIVQESNFIVLAFLRTFRAREATALSLQ